MGTQVVFCYILLYNGYFCYTHVFLIYFDEICNDEQINFLEIDKKAR